MFFRNTSKLLTLFLFGILVFSSFLIKDAEAKEGENTKNVLVLHGEWESWKWTAKFDSYLHAALVSDKNIKVRLGYEYLGLEHVPHGGDPQKIIDHLRYKKSAVSIDLVIGVFPRANKFLQIYGEKLFPGIPKIFALPATNTVMEIQKNPNCISILSAGGQVIETNIERIFSILSDLKHLYIISGIGLHDQTYTKRAKAVIATDKRREAITEFLTGVPLEKLSKKISQLPNDSAVLYLTYEEDQTGKRYSSFDVVSHLTKKANAPIFGFYDTIFGTGIVGGNLTSAENYAKQTADIALQVLAEMSPATSFIGRTSDLYDWRQLQRWNISEKKLPQNSIVRFKNESLWDAYKHHIIAMILLFIFQTVLIYALVINLRKRRLSERELRDSQNRLEEFIEKSPVGIIITDTKNNIEYLNRTFIETFGYTMKDIPTLDRWYQSAHPDLEYRNQMMTQWADRIKSVKLDNSIDLGEQRVACKDGSTCYAEVVGSRIGGKYLIIFNDATQRKEAEDSLVKLAQRLSVHVAQTPLGVIEWDMDAKVSQWNRAAETIFGYTAEEAIGKISANMLIQDADEEELKQIWESLIAQTGGKKSINQNITKNGDLLTCEWYNTTLTDSEGIVIGVASLVLDISESIHLAEQLRQAHKMEAIGTLAGGVAHDFNNILSAILGYAEILKDEVFENQEAVRDVDEVLKAGIRAKELVKQILAFSRKSEQKFTSVAIDLIVKESLRLLRATIPTTIDVKCHISPKCGLILADPTQVHQIIINLCTNSAQAMEETGGTLSVSLDPLTVLPEKPKNGLNLTPGKYVKLCVKDTGIGIPENIIDRVFDPYFTTKGVGKGSGMGLSVVHGIIKSYGGTITVNSELGKGTTFTIFFPQSKKGVDDGFEEIFIQTGKERILVVDDEPMVADITMRRLVKLGYQVTMETDSTKALELFRSDPNMFDLVITDQTMPKMTGEELIKELIAIKPNIKIILCTGYSSKMDGKEADKTGVCGFMMKPVQIEELSRVIRQVFEKDK